MEDSGLKGLKDTELLERFRSTGQNQYFQEIFGRYRKQIQSACLRFFRGNETLAEEAAQDTFLKALQKAGHDTIENFRGWLFRVAKNSCIDIHRKEHGALFESHSGSKSDQLHSSNSAGVQQLQIRIQELIETINELGEKQRISLKLYLQGYSYQEIARITNYSEKEIKSAIQTGKENVKKSLRGIEK